MAKISTILEVTSEDIANGEPLCSHGCAIALAASRKLGGKTVHVTDSIRDSYKGACPCNQCRKYGIPGNKLSDLTQEAITFMRNFDNGSPVEPISFPIEIEESLLAPQSA